MRIVIREDFYENTLLQILAYSILFSLTCTKTPAHKGRTKFIPSITQEILFPHSPPTL